MRIWIRIAVGALALALAGTGAVATAAAAAPEDVACRRQEAHGSGGTAFTLFWSDCEGDSARPVVVLLHGFSATNPAAYEAWIDHLVAGGNTVVFPVYQETLLDEYQVDNAVVATQRAFEVLQEPGHPGVDWGTIAYVGHSGGGGMTLNLAAASAAGIVPRPAVAMPVEGATNLDRSAPGEPDVYGWTPEFSKVPPATRVLFVVGDSDTFVNDELVRVGWPRLGQLDPANLTEAVLLTNKATFPAIWGTHLAPLAPAHVNIALLFEVNAHDRWLWAALDALMQCPTASSNADCLPPPPVVGDRAVVDVASATEGDPQPPFDLPPNAGNVAPYVVRDLLVRLRPWCPVLGSAVCGTQPPKAEPLPWPQ